MVFRGTGPPSESRRETPVKILKTKEYYQPPLASARFNAMLAVLTAFDADAATMRTQQRPWPVHVELGRIQNMFAASHDEAD